MTVPPRMLQKQSELYTQGRFLPHPLSPPADNKLIINTSVDAQEKLFHHEPEFRSAFTVHKDGARRDRRGEGGGQKDWLSLPEDQWEHGVWRKLLRGGCSRGLSATNTRASRRITPEGFCCRLAWGHAGQQPVQALVERSCREEREERLGCKVLPPNRASSLVPKERRAAGQSPPTAPRKARPLLEESFLRNKEVKMQFPNADVLSCGCVSSFLFICSSG